MALYRSKPIHPQTVDAIVSNDTEAHVTFVLTNHPGGTQTVQTMPRDKFLELFEIAPKRATRAKKVSA